MLREIPVEAVEFHHVRALQEQGVAESRHLEYKARLPDKRKEDEKKEFLADVSSFANAGGGDIVWGVVEAKDSSNKNTGLIGDLPGLPETNLDEEMRRLGASIRDGIDPVISGVHWRSIDNPDGSPLLLLRIPRSWVGPHMVTYQGGSKFFARTGTEKRQLDVHELRAAFTESDAAFRRAGQFRTERLGRIVSEQTPIQVRAKLYWCMHVVPIGTRRFERDVVTGAALSALRPMNRSGFSSRHNVDGFLAFDDSAHNGITSYVQLFREGAIEAVDPYVVGGLGGKYLPSLLFERTALENAAHYVALLRSLAVDSPLALSISIFGVSGLRMGVDREAEQAVPNVDRRVFDRDDIILPEVSIESSSVGPSQLRPLFDVLWQAAGWERSLNFNGRGEWDRGG